jgi:hypothetical protein
MTDSRQAARVPEAWYDDDAGPVVRPYAMTSGRTPARPAALDLAELIVAVPSAPPRELSPEQTDIVRRCHRPLSVAEVAAHLSLPVGTVQVLLGDLLSIGVLARCGPAAGERPGPDTLDSVLDGLRGLT